MRYSPWIALPLSALIFSACKPKEQAPAADTTTPAAETPAQTATPTPATPTPPTPTPEPPKPQTPAITPAERAAKLGFARHLPADTQCIVSIHNPAQAVKRIKASQLWNVISEVSGAPVMGDDDLLDDLEEEMDSEQDGAIGGAAIGGVIGEQIPDADTDIVIPDDTDADINAEAPTGGNPGRLLEREITLAFGQDTANQTKNLLTLHRRMSYHQMKSLAQLFAKAAEEEEVGMLDASEIFSEDMAKSLLTDPQAGTSLFALMSMPPIYAAFLSTPENREADSRDITNNLEMLSMMGDGMVTDVEVQSAGVTFSGKKILGAKIAESMADSRGEASEFMGEETFDKLVAEIAKKNLVILTGAVGDYFVVFIGSSENDLRIAASPEESLAASSLAFADPYITKDLLAVVHGSKDLISALVSSAGGFKDMADGLRDGISGSTALGDTRDIETLLQLVADKESDLKKLQSAEATQSVFYFEDGLKGESFGGIDYGAIDWNADNRMGDLAKADGVFLFANLSTASSFDKAAIDYYEAIMETAYTIALKVAEKGGEDIDLAQFTQGIQLFDSKFRVELVNIWKALSTDMEDGLGRERAWVIDLNGSVPPIPGIPQPIIDKAKFPRLCLVAPVADRTKLASSWTRINESSTRILGHVSEMMGTQIPMQKPISSDKDGLTTWFFSMPFFNDDFMPSVTVGDDWFATSTSKVHAVDLIKQASESKSSSKGLVFKIDFKAFQTYLKETMPVLTENAEALNMSPDDIGSLSRMPDAIQELDSLELTSRKENGTIHTSFHFKTR